MKHYIACTAMLTGNAILHIQKNRHFLTRAAVH